MKTPKKNIVIKKQRDLLVDILRGFFVLAMILTHVIGLAFNYSSNNNAVNIIGMIGGTIAFSGFLFISGINSYFSYVNPEKHIGKNSKRIQALLIRCLQIYVIYIILGFISIFFIKKYYLNFEGVDVLEILFNIITFKVIPEYADFLFGFIIFTLSLIPLRRLYIFLTAKVAAGFVFALALLGSGMYLANVNLYSSRLNIIKALFVGHTEESLSIHSFPFFQYFIIFFAGLVIGKLFLETESIKQRTLGLLKVLIPSVVLASLSIVIFLQTGSSLFTPQFPEGRFPPTPSFIFLSFLGVITIVFAGIIFFTWAKFANKFFAFLSKNSIEILLVHLISLFVFKLIAEETNYVTKPSSVSGIIFLTIAVTIVSVNIVFAYQLIVNFLTKKFGKDGALELIINFYILSSIIILALIIYKGPLNHEVSMQVKGEQLTKVLFLDDDSTSWWDYQFRSKRQMVIKNNTSQDFLKGSIAQTEFSFGNFNPDKATLVYLSEQTKTFTELPFKIEFVADNKYKITFTTEKNIFSGDSDANYYIYYAGSHNAGLRFEGDIPAVSITQEITFSDEQVNQFLIGTNRGWYIKTPSTKEVKDKLFVEFDLPEELKNKNVVVNYKIVEKSIQGSFEKSGDNKYKILLDLSSYDPGVYSIQAVITSFEDNIKVVKSYEAPFRVTYPLYVTWSIDWEGWGVELYNLNEMQSISGKYGMPMVQLFNPRIYLPEDKQNPNNPYVPKISEDHAKYLTAWVLDRKNLHGDEIGLHLHMFDDMVKEAGVTPRYDPILGAAYGDTKTYAYTQDELIKIYNWSISRFQEHNLPIPTTYRAGGWMADTHVLQALQGTGFRIDTSGRTSGKINNSVSYSSTVPWDLPITTTPFLPNVNNVNTWEGDRLSVWEFPNNGADSYWFSGDDLKSRFLQNYTDPDGILRKPQVVTYLTHPHWISSIDSPKLRALFDFISNYKYTDGKGPVVFNTLDGVLNEWDTVNLINGN